MIRLSVILYERQMACPIVHELYDVLIKSEKWYGLFYWYSIDNGKVVKSTDGVISGVDNANLSFSIAALIGAFSNETDHELQQIAIKAEAILDAQKEGWSYLYDPTVGLMYAGYCMKYDRFITGIRLQAGDNPSTLEAREILRENYSGEAGYVSKSLGYHIDRTMNESRTVPLWAVMTTRNSDKVKPVPPSAFLNMSRSNTSYKMINGDNINISMTWDGTVFQELLPMLFINEVNISEFMAVQHRNMVKIQNDFINRPEIKLPSLLSSANGIDNHYAVLGIPVIAESYVDFHLPPPDISAGTPHASALSNLADYEISYSLLSNLVKKYPQIVSPYGWYDSINAKGETSQSILGLDEGMYILSLTGHSNSKYVERYLEDKNQYHLLKDMYKKLTP